MQTQPIGLVRAEAQLREWLGSVPERCACGIGIRNHAGHSLANARTFITAGKELQTPPKGFPNDMASVSLYAKEDMSVKGTGGVLCYDIEDTDSMAVVLWSIPFSETLFDIHFAVRVLPRGAADQALFDHVYAESQTPGEMVKQENGFTICGVMSNCQKAVLLVDLRPGEVEPDRVAGPVQSGQQLCDVLHGWIGETTASSACGVGVNNNTKNALCKPAFHLDCGESVVQPPDCVDPGMGSPSFFTKTKYSLRGVGGIVTYRIKDTDQMLCVMWSIPFCEAMYENHVAFAVMPNGDCNAALFRKMKEAARPAKEGKMERDDFGYHLSGGMDVGTHAVCIVTISQL
jgi:hypothetical protein